MAYNNDRPLKIAFGGILIMKKERNQKYEAYNHRILWTTAQKNLAKSRESEKDALYFALSAMLMMYFSFEGYRAHFEKVGILST